MKVIFITREGYGLAGARIRCYNFSRQLRSYGVDARVLSFADDLAALDGADESRMGCFDKLRLNLRAFQSLCRDKKAILYIQRFNYHSFAPLFASIFRSNRIILDLDDWEMREDPGYYLGFYPSSKAHYFTRMLARRSLFCVAASRFLEGFLKEFNRNVCYLPSGVDAEIFKPGAGLAGQDDKVVFSWIGTLHRREYIENLNFALDCFSALRKAHNNIYFDILADGIYLDDLRLLTARFNDRNLRLKNWLHPDKVPGYLDTVSVGLFPNVRENKFNLAKSPTKLFEYMAMAKPSVSSSNGEASFVIRNNGNGLTAPGKKEFIEAMESLIKDKALRDRLGNNARKSVEDEYSLKVLGDRLYQTLKAYDD